MCLSPILVNQGHLTCLFIYRQDSFGAFNHSFCSSFLSEEMPLLIYDLYLCSWNLSLLPKASKNNNLDVIVIVNIIPLLMICDMSPLSTHTHTHTHTDTDTQTHTRCPVVMQCSLHIYQGILTKGIHSHYGALAWCLVHSRYTNSENKLTCLIETSLLFEMIRNSLVRDICYV